jgi:hypothetical protein
MDKHKVCLKAWTYLLKYLLLLAYIDGFFYRESTGNNMILVQLFTQYLVIEKLQG